MNSLGSLAVVLPAYNEAENIEAVVHDSLAYLNSRSTLIPDYRIVVVNDGSRDATPEIIERLQQENPKIIAIHKPNGGYGSALRAGFAVAATTGMQWVHFMDADQQFRLNDLDLLLPLAQKGADFIAGYRISRADTFDRKLKGWLWTLACSAIIMQYFPDMDCAFKLFKVSHLGDPNTLKGDGSAINAEIILRARSLGAKFARVGVNHYPRGGGESACTDLNFIFQSVSSLIRLRLSS